MRRSVTIATIRPAIALAAVYALLLNVLLAAGTPFALSPSADAIICTHDIGGSDQPAGPSTAHDGLCCIAVCGTSIAALPPSDYSRVQPSRAGISIIVEWAVALVAQSPPPNAQASPRGPPSLI
jgi:hypothetical protein